MAVDTDTPEGAAAETAKQSQLPVDGGETLEAVEIEIPGEGEGEAEEPEGKKPEQDKPEPAEGGESEGDGEQERPRKRAQPRINKLTKERDYYAQVADQMKRELDDLRGGYQKVVQERDQLNTVAMENFSSKVDNDLKSAEADYERAVEQGDVRAQIEATKRISKATSQQSDINAWREQAKEKAKAAPETEEKPKPQQQQQQSVELPKEVQSWINRNKSWYDPNSEDFDQDAHVAVTRYAAALEQQMQLEGRDDEVNGSEYWAKIDSFVSRKFPDYAPAKGGTPPMKGSSAVAPARGATPQQLPGQKPASPTKIQLTSDDRKMARSLVDQGALKYPHGHKQFGQRMSYQDAEVYYARQKAAVPPRQARG
jgi:hypothetical protein